MPKKIYKELIEYICNNCLKNFGNKKGNYKTHINRKYPCKKTAQNDKAKRLFTFYSAHQTRMDVCDLLKNFAGFKISVFKGSCHRLGHWINTNSNSSSLKRSLFA